MYEAISQIPAISVIIPLYNKEDVIKNTVNAILRQTYKNLEIIIINDGSTDNSLNVVKAIIDNRIQIINIQNKGVSNARNIGIRKSKGDWIFLIDADDLIIDNCLSILMKLSVKYPEATVLTGNMNNSTFPYRKICCCRQEMLVKNNMKSFFFYRIFPRTGNTLIKKDVFNQVGLFSEKISYFEDLEFDLRLLKQQLIAYTPEVIFMYVQSNLGLSISNKPIEFEFAYYAQINEGSFYEKLLVIENILFSCKLRKNCISNTQLFYRIKLKKVKAYKILVLKILQIVRSIQRNILHTCDKTGKIFDYKIFYFI